MGFGYECGLGFWLVCEGKTSGEYGKGFMGFSFSRTGENVHPSVRLRALFAAEGVYRVCVTGFRGLNTNGDCGLNKGREAGAGREPQGD